MLRFILIICLFLNATFALKFQVVNPGEVKVSDVVPDNAVMVYFGVKVNEDFNKIRDADYAFYDTENNEVTVSGRDLNVKKGDRLHYIMLIRNDKGYQQNNGVYEHGEDSSSTRQRRDLENVETESRFGFHGNRHKPGPGFGFGHGNGFPPPNNFPKYGPPPFWNPEYPPNRKFWSHGFHRNHHHPPGIPCHSGESSEESNEFFRPNKWGGSDETQLKGSNFWGEKNFPSSEEGNGLGPDSKTSGGASTQEPPRTAIPVTEAVEVTTVPQSTPPQIDIRFSDNK